MGRARRTALLVTALHSLLSSPCVAQTEAPNAGSTAAPVDSTAVRVVVTGTRTAEASNRSTLHTGVVTRQDAERRGATSLAEALEGEPNLQVGAGNYDELGNPAGIQMQGLDAERVLILRDGERVVGDSGGVVDLSNFALQDIERVEYVLGPTSSLYGTGALGGVVNVISGPPERMGSSGRVVLEGRSLPMGMFSGSVAHRGNSHWLTGTVTERINGGIQAKSALPDLMLPSAQRLELGLRGGHQGDGVDTVARVNTSINSSDGLTSQQVPGLSRYVTDLPDRNQRVHLQMWQLYESSATTGVRWSISGQHFSGESRKDRRDSPLDERRGRNHLLLTTESVFTSTRKRSTWVAGLRFEREAFAQELDKTTLSGGELVTSTTPEVKPVVLQNGAAFAQVTWQPDERLTLLPGARAELHRIYGAVIAPRLAVAFRASDAFTFRASMGRGFRVPSAKEYGFVFDHAALGYRVLGNRDLNPEQSWGVQGDVTWAVDRHTRLRLGGFRNWITQLIATEYVGQTLLGVDDYSYVNVGRAITSGIDAQASWTVSSTLQAQLAYSYLYTLNQDEHTPLAKRPPHTVTTSLDFEFWPTWRLTARVRGISDAYLTPELTTPGLVRVDFRIEHSLWDVVQVHAGILDLLDSQRDPSRSGDTRPLVGRQVYAGLSAQWPKPDDS
jgi:outer membrane receptor for ferrienterochelin and colicins